MKDASSRIFPLLGKGISGVGRVVLFRVPLPIGLVIILLLLVAGATAYGIKRNPEVLGLLKGPEDIARDERNFIAEVGRSINLPSDEKPSIVTVSDVEKLANQPFFKNAKQDDKVLIYSNNKKIILYRPSERRVIEAGTVNINQQAVAGEATQAARLAIYNGTDRGGLTQEFDDDIKKILPTVEIVGRINAAKNTYTETLIVDLDGRHGASAKLLADGMKAKVGGLPEGEQKPVNTDILIILGKDKLPLR